MQKVLCPHCAQPLSNIGYKIPVPQKNKEAQWRRLGAQLSNENLAAYENWQKMWVKEVHQLEKEIEKNAALTANTGRAFLLKQLKKRWRSLHTS